MEGHIWTWEVNRLCRLDDLPQRCFLKWYTGMQTVTEVTAYHLFGRRKKNTFFRVKKVSFLVRWWLMFFLCLMVFYYLYFIIIYFHDSFLIPLISTRENQNELKQIYSHNLTSLNHHEKDWIVYYLIYFIYFIIILSLCILFFCSITLPPCCSELNDFSSL